MTQIYLDDETRDILRKIRKRDPNFNLSNFIQVAISNYTGEGIEDVNRLYKMIGDNKTKIDFINNENAFLENQIIRIKEKQDVVNIEKKREDEAKQRLIKIDEYLKTVDTYSKDCEYKKGLKEKKWNGLIEYAEIKLKEVNNG